MKTHSKIFISLLFCFTPALVSAQDSTAYHISRGDVLSVEVMEHPEFNRPQIIVLPDGTIQYPAIGNIFVAGKTPSELADTIENVLDVEYVVNPIVTVYVNRIFKESVNIFGAVNMPGKIQIFEPTELMTVIGMAGGIVNVRRVKKIRIMRKNGTTEIINFKRLLNKGDDITNLALLYPDDTVFVEEKFVNWSQLSFFATISYALIRIIEILLL